LDVNFLENIKKEIEHKFTLMKLINADKKIKM